MHNLELFSLLCIPLKIFVRTEVGCGLPSTKSYFNQSCLYMYIYVNNTAVGAMLIQPRQVLVYKSVNHNLLNLLSDTQSVNMSWLVIGWPRQLKFRAIKILTGRVAMKTVINFLRLQDWSRFKVHHLLVQPVFNFWAHHLSFSRIT